MTSMTSMTERKSPQLPLREEREEALRSAEQSASAPQTTSTIQDALVNNHSSDLPLSSLQGRAASLPAAAPPGQSLLDPDVLLRIQKVGGWIFLQNEPTHQNDRAIVLAAVTQNGLALEFVSAELRADPAIVLPAVTQNGLALEFVSAELRADRAIVFAAVTENGRALEYASAELRADRAIVLAAVTQNGSAFRYASERLKEDHAIVLASVTQQGSVLGSVSRELRDNHAIVLAAVTQNGIVLLAASERLRADRAIVLAAVTQNGCALTHASAGLKNDPTFFLAAVTQNGLVLENIPVGLKTIEIACAPVAQNRQAMRFVPEDLIKRANGEIDTNPAFLPFVHRSLITYKIGLQAVKLNPLLLRFVPPEILEQRPVDGTEDNDIILLALKQNPEALHLIPWELLTGAMLSFVIEMHKRDNKRSLILSLVKLARIMGAKHPFEIRNPHLDLAWPLLEFFKDSKEIMLILIKKYGLEASDAGPQIILDPYITAADRQVLDAALTGA